ncbi:MAG TPA: carboxypeptidase regulatory-like domain-containing protein [Bryobacteraceae bacterium]|nr:carboxypeptidase regulatory-like domain-containing protein [Bryobacteraceae bacterium]
MGPKTRALNLCLLVFCCLASAAGQDEPAPPPAISPPPVAAPIEEQAPGTIQGTVVSGATGQPLRRAQVLLRAADSKGAPLFQTTDESGGFSFPKVAPGSYIITVQRDGYLPLSAGRIGSYKMPPIFTVTSGQTISSFVYRLTPAGVVSGKIKFDDAEPAVSVTIQLYRSYYDRGRHGYAMAASALTDDRGQYRVHGLEPGTYYVAALYQAPQHPPGAQEQLRTDAQGNPLPQLSYAVTFFPEAQKMSDAVPVKIAPGDEVDGIDIFLTLVHTVHVRGHVIGASEGGVVTGASVALRWNDPDNTASVSAPISVTVDKDQNFDITGVTSGPYLLIASGVENGVTLTGRVPINIGESDVSNADILVGPESKWNGKVSMEGDDAPLPKGLVVSLEPRRPIASVTRAQVSANGEFTIPFISGETYDLFVLNGPKDSYLKSVRVANAERLTDGLEASAGAAPADLEVVLGIEGGQVVGRAVTSDPKIVASGATIALIPDPATGHIQSYQTTHADEYGNFYLQGLAPGKYLLLGWLDQAPCDLYNPNDFLTCQTQGVALTVAEGEEQTAQVTAN